VTAVWTRVVHNSRSGKSPAGVLWNSGLKTTCCPAGLLGVGVTAVVIPQDLYSRSCGTAAMALQVATIGLHSNTKFIKNNQNNNKILV